MVRHSNIDLLYKEYKNAQSESEREEKYKKLCDEMSKMAYRYASNNRFIGEQNASEFLISVMEKFQSIINNRNNMEVDFALFYARVLEIYTKNYIKKDKSERLYRASVIKLHGMEMADNLIKQSIFNDDDCKVNPKLKKLLELKTVRVYLMTHASVLNDHMLKNIAVAMGADGADFIDKLIRIKKQCDDDEEIKKSRDLSSSYLVKKIVGEMDERENKERRERLERFIDNHVHIRKRAQKVPYTTVSEAFEIKKSSVSHDVANGKRLLQKYNRERTRGITL